MLSRLTRVLVLMAICVSLTSLFTSGDLFSGDITPVDPVDVDLSASSTGEDESTYTLDDEIAWLKEEAYSNIVVTSVSKREQKLLQTASAAFVITQEDIRRSGVTSIPEALRMAPGLQVAQITSNRWAITARGFNDQFADKLLVMIDGRTVYTPLFSGVYWDVQDVVMADVERIEVIRGPGGTIWGANAVNGVINIITKDSADTRGGLAVVRGGDEEEGTGVLRYGGEIGDDISYRLFGKYFGRDSFEHPDGLAHDDWDMVHAGFRADWDISRYSRATLQGDIYEGHSGKTTRLSSSDGTRTFDESSDVGGGNLLARLSHTLSATSDIETQLYFDNTQRKDATTDEIHNTFDIDIRHRFETFWRQQITWGGGYRLIRDEIDTFTESVMFDPTRRSRSIYNVFVQDEISLLPDRLGLTVGSKLEYNDFTEFEVEPTVRLSWTPNEGHTVWGAVSRAVVIPSRSVRDFRLNVTLPDDDGLDAVIAILGNANQAAKNMIASEIGYRFVPRRGYFVDIAMFYNTYDDLTTTVPLPVEFALFPTQRIIFPSRFDNTVQGETYGAELFVDGQVTERWRLAAGYTFLQEVIGGGSDGEERSDPHNQFQMRSHLDLPYDVEFDTALYYVEGIPHKEVKSYIRLDARLGWQPTDNLEFSMSLQNLLDSEHKEFGGSDGVIATQPERAIFGQISLSF